MRSSEALAILKRTDCPVLRTNDAAALWRVSRETASKTLSRIAGDGHIQRLVRSIWLIDPQAHSWSLHPFLTDPAPSYLSLQTALFHHGMIEQIPKAIHVMTPTKTRTLKTPVGLYILHQLTPSFFCGFEPLNGGPAQMALPEKTLVDFCYFRLSRSRAFRALSEVELPGTFRKSRALGFAKLINSVSRRRIVEQLIENLMPRIERASKFRHIR